MFKPRTNKSRKGFSLVELVIVILIIAILAVAIFAGGSIIIKKAQVSQTTSDLHNFSIAVESTLNENPSVANLVIADADDDAAILEALNENLPIDYQMAAADLTNDATANLTFADGATWNIYKSVKTDAWDNPYYIIIDSGERHGDSKSDFYITVISAGPNAKTVIGGAIESDDIFLLGQYTDGDVSAYTYNCDKVTLVGGYDADAATEGAALTCTDATIDGDAMYVSLADGSTSSTTTPVNY